MEFKKLTWFETSVVALCAALFLWWLYPTAPAIPIEEEPVAREAEFSVGDIQAKSAYVLDAKTGKALYEKEPELQWPLASLTKLMVALAARSVVPDYLLVRITSEDIREEGDTGLLTDEEWNIGKLIDFSLIVSSNDGIRAIAGVAGSEIAGGQATSSPEKLFLDRMNSLAKEIGMTETYFLNHSGLDVSTTLSGGYGSAKDMAVLVDHILKTDPHMLEATSFSKISIDSNNKNHNAVNTNKALMKIPSVLASKTGYTELSGGNVVVAFNAGLDRPVIVSVLGSTYEGRFEDLNALVEATLRYFSEK